MNRINIAKTTLDLVNTETVIPRAGTYLRAKEYVRGSLQLEKVLEQTQCYACAIGALMCGAATLLGENNGISLETSESQVFMVDYLERNDFSYKEIAKIEYFLEDMNYIANRVYNTGLSLSNDEMSKIDEYKRINNLSKIADIKGVTLSDYERNRLELSKELVVHLLNYIINNEGKLPF
jgi:hypothetical protein